MSKLHSIYFNLALAAMLALVSPLFFGQVVGAQTVSEITTPSVPDNLKAPLGEKPVLKVLAKGVQIYTCTASTTNASGFEWVFKAPQAELYNEQGVVVGKHYAGPTWEANDGSKVVGVAQEKSDPSNGKAIPWLLLKAKSHEGNGVLSKVTSVQRLETVDGLAPAASDCNQSRKDNEVSVAYTASYYFYTATTASAGVPATGEGGSREQQNFFNLSLLIGLGLVLTAGLAGMFILVSRHLGKNSHKA